MNVYSTEEEQIAAIKQFWNRYGTPILLVIAVGLAINFGMRTWRNHEMQLGEKASLAYEHLMVEAQDSTPDQIKQRVLSIKQSYPSTPYASLAALLKASADAKIGQLKEAATELQWVRDNSKQLSMKQLATLRLAKIKISNKQYDKALALLDEVKQGLYAANALQLKGDVFVMQKKYDAARTAYDSALNSLPKNSGVQPLLQMKLDNLTALQSMQ